MILLSTISLLSALLFPSSHAHALRARTSTPAVASTTLVGVAIDGNLQRDSGLTVSQLIGGRALWIYRDTQVLTNQSLSLLFNGTFSAFLSSSASWSDESNGEPRIDAIPADQGQKEVTGHYPGQLTQYGDNTDVLYTVQPDECPENGACNDNTRFVIWPDSPPLVTSTGDNGTVTMYQFIRDAHITDSLGVVDSEPPGALYKLTYNPDKATSNPNLLPTSSIVQEYFWPHAQFSYGVYGGLVGKQDGKLYLWGQSYENHLALARVCTDTVEDQSTYEYYYNNGTWSSTAPTSVNDTSVYITAGAGGQGTYLWSEYFDSYLWLGQGLGLEGGVADLYAATAPAPEGPWTTAQIVHSYPNGNASQPAYTLVAHQALATADDEMYISYTLLNTEGPNKSWYETPLYQIKWQ